MQKLYQKSELAFSLIFIIIYVVGTSIADAVSIMIHIPKLITFIFLAIITCLIIRWLKKNSLLKKYGICKTDVKISRFLYFIPLVFLSSVNFWFGIKMNMPIHETVFYVLSMMCVGFLEEIVFRGFLFKAMAKNNLSSAIVVSSVTFGIGHIINLFNSNHAELIPNICQICEATAFGFLFVIIFHRGKTLLPCIISHSAINMMSAFSNTVAYTHKLTIIISIVLCITATVYMFILTKTLPKKEHL